MSNRFFLLAVAVVGLWWTTATATAPKPTIAPMAADMSALWSPPADLEKRDLFNGTWGASLAPDPHAVYTFVRTKQGGANPGVVVRDSAGRTWHVKQGKESLGFEGPVEVALSRVLGAIGYHQPPVYFLPTFTMTTEAGEVKQEPGGRFRLDEKSLKGLGPWSWLDNPFTGTQPLNGLLVILLMFNSWDLKDSNNTIYEVGTNGASHYWYVVRDLGGALGEGHGMRPHRNNIDKFERQIFITRVSNGLVEFDYQGKQPELFKHRISTGDVQWAADLIGRLSRTQWDDAFRAGGYPPDLRARFIAKLQSNIAAAHFPATAGR